MSGARIVTGIIAGLAVLAGGVCIGWSARGTREETRQAVRAQQDELARLRRIADTKRVSVARAGTRPGRVSKAAIDMGASHMQQHSREVD